MAWLQTVDELGFRVELEHRPERIVSLVPSWTETLFAFRLKERIVGITRFCVVPPETADITKIGGTKNPNLDAIAELAPDLVIANAEENRREDIEHLRNLAIAVFTTYPRKIASAVESIMRLGSVVGCEPQANVMARGIVREVSAIETELGAWAKLRFRAFCPIWKNPWMSFNADTYAHDVLRMLGFNNIFAAAGERYPRTTIDEAIAQRPDFVLLPDEPYEFRAKDVEELKPLLPQPLSRRVILVPPHASAASRNSNCRSSKNHRLRPKGSGAPADREKLPKVGLVIGSDSLSGALRLAHSANFSGMRRETRNTRTGCWMAQSVAYCSLRSSTCQPVDT